MIPKVWQGVATESYNRLDRPSEMKIDVGRRRPTTFNGLVFSHVHFFPPLPSTLLFDPSSASLPPVPPLPSPPPPEINIGNRLFQIGPSLPNFPIDRSYLSYRSYLPTYLPTKFFIYIKITAATRGTRTCSIIAAHLAQTPISPINYYSPRLLTSSPSRLKERDKKEKKLYHRQHAPFRAPRLYVRLAHVFAYYVTNRIFQRLEKFVFQIGGVPSLSLSISISILDLITYDRYWS